MERALYSSSLAAEAVTLIIMQYTGEGEVINGEINVLELMVCVLEIRVSTNRNILTWVLYNADMVQTMFCVNCKHLTTKCM